MSSKHNPHFARADRAAYELGHLLRKLPENLLAAEHLALDQRLIVQAARNHADNASTTLLRGIEALGSVLLAAGTDAQSGIEPRILMGLGELIAHLAVEAQFVRELSENLGNAIEPPEFGGTP
ncbi:hypothetical protein GJV26_16995 [Massilia dura]|uniref:Uncharacterized protein n=1 Tax=Pseudoduganella dura TaxID=321982 RepID=A0A6I3XKH7_9BURK|nr:hypothetical protein [Pseudoduganella dura]MUI14141.1 hypothetical protein [Pseudoduganella dura]GGX76826.1 hypothetical protein GCM10007386_05020 [Pseudoduganella dura]